MSQPAPFDAGRMLGRADPLSRVRAIELMRSLDALVAGCRGRADLEGKLWLGEEGEKRYGRAHFRQLHAAFDSPKLVSVRWDKREIGMVDAGFLAATDSGEERGSFVLAGRPWQVVTVEWERGLCVVKPGADGRARRWNGSPRHLSYAGEDRQSYPAPPDGVAGDARGATPPRLRSARS